MPIEAEETCSLYLVYMYETQSFYKQILKQIPRNQFHTEMKELATWQKNIYNLYVYTLFVFFLETVTINI